MKRHYETNIGAPAESGKDRAKIVAAVLGGSMALGLAGGVVAMGDSGAGDGIPCDPVPDPNCVPGTTNPNKPTTTTEAPTTTSTIVVTTSTTEGTTTTTMGETTTTTEEVPPTTIVVTTTTPEGTTTTELPGQPPVEAAPPTTQSQLEQPAGTS